MSIDTLRERHVIAKKLIEYVKEQYSDESVVLVNQAITFAEEYYAKFDHPTGKPYIQYALEVANNLVELHPDPIVLAATFIYPPPPVEADVLPVLKKTFK